MVKHPLFGGVPGLFEEERFAHGGHIRRLADKAGCSPDELVDFSASVNPLGPPPWLGQEIARAVRLCSRYPDPESLELCLAACELYKVWPNQVLAGNGASEIIQAVARLGGVRQAVIPSPSYVDYERACQLAGLPVRRVPLSAEDDFALDFAHIEPLLEVPSLVFVCLPNNPTGQIFEAAKLRALAERFPNSRFVVDESFADFVTGLDRLVRKRPENVVVVHSLTKFFAIPGLRLGLAFANPEVTARLKRLLPAWSVNAVAQKVGERCLRDQGYAEESRALTRRLREELAASLAEIPGLKVFPGQANFLLCQMRRVGLTAKPVSDKLLASRISIRICDNFAGLDESYFRVAVRNEADNAKLIEALRAFSGLSKPPAVQKPRRVRAIMVQATGSNAGKSVLVAALCRILLQDGVRVAPFKAQNMSLNSFVTREGFEMGRAQVTQALACRLEPDVRMNPVLLKPGSDTGAQVIVMGRPVGAMSVAEYIRFKPQAFEAVKKAYDELAREYDVIVLEGAGSPAEVNLKAHDIVNMRMAEYANAKVLLAGDIDRGGVFAALAGTMDLLEESERARVAGFVINKFRGDAKLLDPALSFLFERTGKPVLGVVPHIEDLGLPEEDSVSFKDRIYPGAEDQDKPDACIDIACIDLPHISNFNDLDPLFAEPDVRVRIVDSPFDLGIPDAVILPGSKNTISDMKRLKGMGMAAAIRSLPQTTRIVGICAGFQMLGTVVEDPYKLESSFGSAPGLGLLPVTTTLMREKTLTRTVGTHLESGHRVHGYEIHHGVTRPLSQELSVAFVDQEGNALGFGLSSGRVLGTYLHGVFDSDEFRRWFVDSLRRGKGLPPLSAPQTTYELETALDHLASVVRGSLDMDRIYEILGLTANKQAHLFYRLGKKR